MKFEATTIKDIAKALGLSTSTISRALRDSYEISEETKKLVLECAEKLNYRPNPIALITFFLKLLMVLNLLLMKEVTM
jgi:LacI family transcriptional regulator